MNTVSQSEQAPEYDAEAEKEQLITPAWMKEIDDINDDIALFKEQRLNNEESLRVSTEKKTLLTSELQQLQKKNTDIKTALKNACDELHQTKDNLTLYKKSTRESVRYWFSLATGGLFKSHRYSSELNIVRLSKQIEGLQDANKANDVAIDKLETEISQQEAIIKKETKLLAIDDQVTANALKMIAELESSGLNAINEIRVQCDGWSSFLNKTPVVYFVKQFVKEPTPSRLNQLLEKMGEDTAYLKNSKVKNIIVQLGNLYPAIGDRHTLCEKDALLKQQQIEHGRLLAETDQEKTCHEVLSNAETDLLLLQDQYQQLSYGLLDKKNISLAIEKAEMKDSIFLRDDLIRKEKLTQIINKLEEIDQQHNKLVSYIAELNSKEELKQTDLMETDFSVDTNLANYQQSLQKELIETQNEINSYTKKYTKKQKEQISQCTTPLDILELDIAINRKVIDRIENDIQQIQNGEQAEVQAVQDKINITQEIIETTKQSEQTVIKENNQALKNIDVSAFIERPDLKTLVRACINFKVAPTNDNLSSLIAAIKIDIHRESNPLLLDKIKKIGSMYGAVSDAVAFAQEQKPSVEQMKSEILFTCELYRQQQLSIDNTPLSRKFFAFWNKDTPETFTKENDITTSDLAVINALKSFLTNDAKAKDSHVIIAKYIQSLDIDNPTKTSRLVAKTSEINQQIQSLYTVVQATQQTTAFKERFEEQKRSASPQSVAEIDIIEDGQANLLNDRYKIDNQP